MKVSELITKLQELNEPEMEVRMYDYESEILWEPVIEAEVVLDYISANALEATHFIAILSSIEE